MVRLLATLIIILAILSGCGYGFKGHVVNIAGVEAFGEVTVTNSTYQPEIELIVREDIITMFSSNGWYKKNIMGDRVLLACDITGYKNSPAAHRSDDSISQYEVTLEFDVTVSKRETSYDKKMVGGVSVKREQAKENILITLPDKKYSELYSVSDDVNITAINKRKAIMKISKKFTLDLEDSISQGF